MRVEAWRDPDAAVNAAAPALSLGERDVVAGAAAASELAASGARLVRLGEPVDSRTSAAVPALSLVRDLTAFGVAVDWELAAGPAPDWWPLSHLHPPRGGPPAALDRWRADFFLGRFVVRRGPAFYQFRDWRWDWLRLSTVDDPVEVELITALLDGAETVDAGHAAAARLTELRLLHRIGDRLWLPAYRVRRWPVPAYLV
jgi:hypothetical protein